MTKPVLSMRDVTIRFNDHVAVSGLTLTLHRGEVFGVVGESGSGKTTLGLAALGHLRSGAVLDNGEICLSNENLFSMSLKRRRMFMATRGAYVAQSAISAFNPLRRLQDQIIEAVVRIEDRRRNDALKDCEDLFHRLGLPKRYMRAYPHQLSGGELQRAMLAMALIEKPSLIVFDEPTSALDVTTQRDVLRLIKSILAEAGISALYISHDLALVVQMADRIAVMRDGMLLEDGPVERLLSHPGHPYTRQLIEERSNPQGAALSGGGDPLLDIRIHKAGYRRDKPILDNIHFHINRGQIYALVGESGSGKTSIARAIAGLIPHVDGAMTWKGQALAFHSSKRPMAVRRLIQYVTQAPDQALNPAHKIGFILSRPLSLYFRMKAVERTRKIAELLEQTGLSPDLVDRYPPELSGGQKQRVAIARAIAAQPDLIICDEITSALDPLVAAEIMELLRQLQNRYGMAYLFISHDLDMVRRLAPWMGFVKKGKLIAQGVTQQLMKEPPNNDVRDFVEAIPEMKMGWLAAP